MYYFIFNWYFTCFLSPLIQFYIFIHILFYSWCDVPLAFCKLKLCKWSLSKTQNQSKVTCINLARDPSSLLDQARTLSTIWITKFSQPSIWMKTQRTGRRTWKVWHSSLQKLTGWTKSIFLNLQINIPSLCEIGVAFPSLQKTKMNKSYGTSVIQEAVELFRREGWEKQGVR